MRWDVRRDNAAETAGTTVAKYADYGELLDRKDIDAVIVATWDNMHAPIAAAACRAGKDVYVEKPMTSAAGEGHDLVRAVRETGRVLQVGVQQRSMPVFQDAKRKFFDSGLMGDVHMVRTIWNANTGYLFPVPPGMETKPDGLDWDACLGWLPKIAWHPEAILQPLRVLGHLDRRADRRPVRPHGGRGALVSRLTRPVSAVAGGGIFQYDDGRDTPDNINLIVTYPQNVNVTFEATITDLIAKDSAQIVFMGTGGRLSIFRDGYRFIPAEKNSQIGREFRAGRRRGTAHRQLAGINPIPQGAERQCRGWPLQRDGLPPRQHGVPAERAGELEEGVGRMNIGVNMEFIRCEDKPFAAGVERAAQIGFKFVEPMVHNGRELLSEAGYFHSFSMDDDPLEMRDITATLWRESVGAERALPADAPGDQRAVPAKGYSVRGGDRSSWRSIPTRASGPRG